MGEHLQFLSYWGVALAVGLLATTVARLLRDRRRGEVLPLLAERLGLVFEPSESSAGAVTGDYRERYVRIDPEEIVVYHRDGHRIQLGPVPASSSRPQTDMVKFTSGRATFDRIFQERWATPTTASRMQDPELTDLLVRFHARWRSRQASVKLRMGAVTCTFTPGALRTLEGAGRLFHDVYALCEHVEAVLSGEADRHEDELRRRAIQDDREIWQGPNGEP